MKNICILIFLLSAMFVSAQKIVVERASFNADTCDVYFFMCFKANEKGYIVKRNKTHWLWDHVKFEQGQQPCKYTDTLRSLRRKWNKKKKDPATIVALSEIDNNILYMDYFCNRIKK